MSNPVWQRCNAEFIPYPFAKYETKPGNTAKSNGDIQI